MDGIAAALGIAVALMHVGAPVQPTVSPGRWAIHASAGKTIVPFLGDEDPRRNTLIGVQYYKPEPRFRFRRKKANLMQELYYEHSESPGASGEPANKTDAGGYLFGAEYTWGLRGNLRLYGTGGLGVQYVSRRTVDLPSRLNSTPFLDLRLGIPAGVNEILIGARFLHISNAHQSGNNQGQNQLFFDVGYRF
jgi:hypothetical protein